jgi:ribosomal protein S18 acetylase RimI-like enzyme
VEPQLRHVREAAALSAPADIEIREARPDEYGALGDLTVAAYKALPGIPDEDGLPGYFEDMRDVARRASQAGVVMLVAARGGGELLGGVTFCEDLKAYGAPTSADLPDAAGIRMLAIVDSARGLGLGRALTEECLRRSRALGRAEVVLHTTEVMPIARGLYERMGFERAPELDFSPGGFLIMGFRLAI